MESVFEFLFKYRPVLFEQGDLAFRASWPLAVLLGVGGALAALAAVTYLGPRGRATRLDRGVMAGLRVATLGVLVFCLFRPSLVLTSVVPQRNFVGVLVDDSRSMDLPGEDGATRADFVRERLATGESGLVDALSERFAVRYFRFSSSAARVDDPTALAFDGTRTDLAAALDHAREELSGVPLSGLVVLTDGADNGGRTLEEALVPLQAASVPVYTVGLGDEVVSPDVQLGRIDVPRTVLQGSALVVDVVLVQRGFDGTVPLVVEDGDRLLATREVELEDDGEPTLARVHLRLDEPGPRTLVFRVPVREGERVERNNRREVTVEVRAAREKILYLEGEPRFEVKFVRRAVEDDENLQVVVLQRTAEDKFLRLAVDSGDELAGGFPRTREELFAYSALILGSVEASFFTHDQLDMIADFVGRRGGGLLVLGGRNALAEGGYAGTPVAEVLPVHLEDPAPDPRAAFTEVEVRPTLAGLNHPAIQITPEADSVEAVFDRLPALTTMNRVVRVKPGATSLLEGRSADGEDRVALAHHRYGRGKALALPVQDTWMWQMHADVPLEDTSHETFWQQLLRWLVDGVPEHVEVEPARDRVEPGESVALTARVTDSTYLEVNDARAEAVITAPSGAETRVPLEWSVEEDGVYRADFTPAEGGDHAVSVTVLRGADTLGVDRALVRAGPGDEEFFDAGRRTDLLRRVAEDTGGRFYTVSTVDGLAEDIQYTGAGVTLTEERDLWDMPALFLLLLGLMAGEWGFRRARGLV